MNNILIKRFVSFISISLFAVAMQAQPIAFPGAEGYGRFATGGRGDGTTGRVAVVTNLLDHATNPPVGSFRWALKQGEETVVHPILGAYIKKMPLTIVFQVGGVINLKTELRVERSNLTIAGQTAPGDGICFRGGTLNFSGSSNVIVRYIRSRPGDELGEETSAFRIENGGNFIIDHCSFSWGIEETTHFSSNTNTTVQWCIISESLYNSVHKKGARGYGTQWGGQYGSYHHNLLAHHNSRMPRINGSNENDVEAMIDYRNNVNFNWGSGGAFYGGEWESTNGKGFSHINVVNNYYRNGPASASTTFAAPSLNRTGRTLDGYAQWYFAGNVMDGNAAKTADNWLGVDAGGVGGVANIRWDEEMYKTNNITGAVGELENYSSYTETAESTLQSVIANVGATLPKRDAIDARVIGEVKGDIPIIRYKYTTLDDQVTPIQGVTKGIIDTQNNLVPSGAPEGTTPWDIYTTTTSTQTDTDSDGIPDTWETLNGLNPNDAEDGKLISDSDYSNLELFLNGLTGATTAVTEHIAVEPSVILFPQPMTDVLNFSAELPVYRVEIYDSAARLVKVSKLYTQNGTINVSKLSKGTYIVKAEMQDGIVVTKQVVK